MRNILSLFTKPEEIKGAKPFSESSISQNFKRLLLQLSGSASAIKMTPEEKQSTWDVISARTFLMATEESVKEPVRKPVLSRLYYGGLIPAINQQSRFFHKKKYALGIIAGTLIVSGGVSAFAQGSLPGDFFYPVKTDVNEKIQITLAFTPQEKANVEAILATKRLEEVERLSLEGKLNLSLKQQTGENFDTHVRKFEAQLTELDNRSEFSDIAKAGVFFQTRIAVHAAILKDMDINSKVLSSTKAINKTPEAPANYLTVTSLEDKVLAAVVPTITVTDKALTKMSADTLGQVEVRKYNSGQHKDSMDINLEEARRYLLKLHQDVGTPAPVFQTTPTSTVSPVFVPQILP